MHGAHRRALLGLLAALAVWLGTAATAAAENVPVPDVRGLSEAQARRAVAAAGLVLGGVERLDVAEVERTLGRRYAAGVVFQQAPPPSSAQLPSMLPRGGRVWLRVTSGGATRTTPVVPTPPVPTPPVPTPPVATPPGRTPTVPMPVAPRGTTPRSYPGGTRPPPPPAPPGVTTPTTPVPPGPATVPMPTQPVPTRPLVVDPGRADIAGFVEVPSEPRSPPGAAGTPTQRTQYSLPCERLRDVWSIQGIGGWAFTAGSDAGDDNFIAGFDVTRWWDGCFGLGLYYRYTAQTFDRRVPGGILEDAGGFHHLGIKLSYQSTFSPGSAWYWWAGLGFGWFGTAEYQRDHSGFEGYGAAGIGYLFHRRMRLRAGLDLHVTPTKAGRFDPGRDGSTRILWWFNPHIALEFDF